MSAPKSIGRCTYGLANVLSTTTATPRSCATAHAAARSVSRSIGLVGVSRNSIFVFGRIAARDRRDVRRVDVGEVELILPQHALEQPVGAAVGVVGDDDVVAGLRAASSPRRSAAMPEANANAALPSLDGGDVGLQRRARRVLRPRVLVALVHAQCLLDVGGCLVDRGDDGAGRWVRFLAGMDAIVENLAVSRSFTVSKVYYRASVYGFGPVIRDGDRRL